MQRMRSIVNVYKNRFSFIILVPFMKYNYLSMSGSLSISEKASLTLACEIS